jgi:hypothetical protein
MFFSNLIVWSVAYRALDHFSTGVEYGSLQDVIVKLTIGIPVLLLSWGAFPIWFEYRGQSRMVQGLWISLLLIPPLPVFIVYFAFF